MTDTPITFTLAADQKRIFPGETVQIEARAVAVIDMADVTITLNAPAMCMLDAAPFAGNAAQVFVAADDTQTVAWRVEKWVAHAPATFSLSISVPRDGWHWHNAEQHRLLHFDCSLNAANLAKPATDHLTLAVMRRAALVKYLPGIYQGSDAMTGMHEADEAVPQDFMSRFLMLIERLAEPTESRIEQLAWYFDRTVAPAHLLPWLAWCLSFRFHESWDETRQRRALGEMSRLYRQRGTKAGLKGLLALYFDERPSIIEYGASHLRLGNESKLGLNTALGDKRRPHTFRVEFRRRMTEDDMMLARALIDANKPAHTAFELISIPALTETQ